MSNFFDDLEKVILYSVDDQKYINRTERYVCMSKKFNKELGELPTCEIIFWKKSGNRIIEMTKAEKDAVKEARKRQKNDTEIMSEILAHPVLGDIKASDLLDDFPSFDVAIRKGNLSFAVKILDKALSRNKITAEEHATLKTIVTDKI